MSADEKRDRVLITVGGIVPDLDGLGAIFDVAAKDSGAQLDLYSKYHHQIAHNLTFGIVMMLGAMLLAKRKIRTALIFLVAFHIHLLCDLIGARGPDGYQWPIPYSWPFSSSLQLNWQSQWGLVSWQNYAITILMLVMVFVISYRKKYSPLEIFSSKWDRQFVHYLAKRLDK